MVLIISLLWAFLPFLLLFTIFEKSLRSALYLGRMLIQILHIKALGVWFVGWYMVYRFWAFLPLNVKIAKNPFVQLTYSIGRIPVQIFAITALALMIWVLFFWYFFTPKV